MRVTGDEWDTRGIDAVRAWPEKRGGGRADGAAHLVAREGDRGAVTRRGAGQWREREGDALRAGEQGTREATRALGTKRSSGPAPRGCRRPGGVQTRRGAEWVRGAVHEKGTGPRDEGRVHR